MTKSNDEYTQAVIVKRLIALTDLVEKLTEKVGSLDAELGRSSAFAAARSDLHRREQVAAGITAMKLAGDARCAALRAMSIEQLRDAVNSATAEEIVAAVLDLGDDATATRIIDLAPGTTRARIIVARAEQAGELDHRVRLRIPSGATWSDRQDLRDVSDAQLKRARDLGVRVSREMTGSAIRVLEFPRPDTVHEIDESVLEFVREIDEELDQAISRGVVIAEPVPMDRTRAIAVQAEIDRARLPSGGLGNLKPSRPATFAEARDSLVEDADESEIVEGNSEYGDMGLPTGDQWTEALGGLS